MKPGALIPVLLATVVTVVGGCKLASPPSQSQRLTSALPAATTIPAQWGSPADTNTVANDWVKSFNDPRLDSLVAEALTNNLDLHAPRTSRCWR